VKLNYYSLGYLLLAIVSGIAYGFAGTVLKKGVVNLKLSSNVFELLWRVVTAKYIMISLLFSAAGYILYMIIIRKAEIITSTLIIQGVLFLSTIFFAFLIFKETISPSKILSLVLIMAGIAVLLAGR
jgi:multidrug transporter EmrE-like cation transporter